LKTFVTLGLAMFLRIAASFLALMLTLPAGLGDAAASEQCANPETALGVSRIIEIDTSNGPLYGRHSRFAREDNFLAPKEVVITLDDGPLPAFTRPILDTLDDFCTKATFFPVGKMALAYPALIKEEMARGHTVGSHTWSHPKNVGKLVPQAAVDQIERGHAAVTVAAGQPIAPFFRFPGLNDSNPLLAHLQQRGIATFTVDAISNDSYIKDPVALQARVMGEVEKYNGGIMLFHDIKASTAKALPGILKALKDGGYKVVHLRAKGVSAPVAAIAEGLSPQLSKLAPADTVTHQMQPLYPTIVALQPGTAVAPEVTSLAPEARSRPGAQTLASVEPGAGDVARAKPRSLYKISKSADGALPSVGKTRWRADSRKRVVALAQPGPYLGARPRPIYKARRVSDDDFVLNNKPKPKLKRAAKVKRAVPDGGPLFTYGP
jgi:peptidoglycan-N-acetylglucosamine deacetylase